VLRTSQQLDCFFRGGSLERLLMLDFPMVVILLHLGGQHLTTPYFETICLHFLSAVCLHFQLFCWHLVPIVFWWIWFKVEIEWCLFKRHNRKFSKFFFIWKFPTVEGWKRGKLFSLALFFYNYIVLEFDSGTKWSLAFFINSWLRKNFDGEFLSFFSYNFLYFWQRFVSQTHIFCW